jgi:hypothetical protein
MSTDLTEQKVVISQEKLSIIQKVEANLNEAYIQMAAEFGNRKCVSQLHVDSYFKKQ